MNKSKLGRIPKNLEWIAQRAPTGQAEISNDNNTPVLNSAPAPEEVKPIVLETPRPTNKTSSHANLEAGWTRATVIIKEEHMNKFKVLASIQGLCIKDVLDQAVSQFFASSEIKAMYRRWLDNN